MKIFIVNGKGGSGKTTFENYIKKLCSKNDLECEVISIIDYVKEIASLCKWNGSKTNKDRKFLCDLKKLLTDYNSLPLQIVLDEVKIFVDECYDVLFIDMREKEDIDNFKKYYNAKTILVDNSRTRNNNYGNSADDEVYNYEYDIIIHNDSTIKDLQVEASIFYNSYILGDLNDD